MSRAASDCFPRTRLGTLGGTVFFDRSAFFRAFFISCHSLAHFFRCSFHQEDEEEGMFLLASDLPAQGGMCDFHPTSTRSAAVAREMPTYSFRKQKSGASVSSSRTTPGRVSPCTLA